MSQNAFCFLTEANGAPVGECWLQKMNLPPVLAMYGPETDLRRIDMSIGEKQHWNKGVGSLFIGMLVDFAFCGEHADALHCFCEDYNVRSRRMWEKHGFDLVLSEDLPQPQKGKRQLHYALTRARYIQSRRFRPPEERVFETALNGLQPSQLYISEGKLRLVREWFDPQDRQSFDPIPVIRQNGHVVMTDGHTRAAAACLAGWDSVPVYWDEDPIDMAAYAANVGWCLDEGIRKPSDLAGRIVPHRDYEALWRRRCMEARPVRIGSD